LEEKEVTTLLLNKVVNLQKAVIVTDSTFLLCRASEEILRERREALYFFCAYLLAS
jgi:hypothetical protein